MKKFLFFAALATSTLPITAVLGALPASASAPNTDTGTFNGYGAGYSNVIGTTSANTVILKINGQNIPTYCVNQSLVLDTTTGDIFSPISASQVESSGVTASGLAYASDIAVNGASLGTALSNPNDEAASEQLAIWYFTNNLNYSSVGDQTIVARANQLVADATPLTPTNSYGYTLTATSVPSGNSQLVSVTLVNANGVGVANQTISVSGAPISSINTNQNGVATFTEPGNTSANLSFKWTGTVSAGTLYAPPGSSQPLIITSSVPTSRTTTLTLNPITTTTTATTTTQAPTTQAPPTTISSPPTSTPLAPPTTITPSSKLPYTGSWVTPTLIWGSLSLVVAAGTALVIRKRQLG
jgi:hypothetical protein